MAELKTKETGKSVELFIETLEDDSRKKECYSLLDIFKETTGEEPKVWGNNIIGFGSYHYKYESGREGDWFICGFSPKKANLTVYLMAGFEDSVELLQRLGKYKTGKSCLYIKNLDGIDTEVLKELIKTSNKKISEMYK